ncbi:hypothetical protein [Hymenobacter frigidus]|uniref:hypothetical protein n=1 Tax=Hymenobacter frigidus TaxID=1524095 RepID=UPI00166356F6|nr:hypothetical protein [Hymenobacter frigidus]
MSNFEITLFFIAFGHIMAGSIYNKYRIRKLLNYISVFRGTLLDENDFSTLLDKYTSFLAPMQLFPGRKGYPALYSNEEFAEFCHNGKLLIGYIYFVSFSCIVAAMW